MLSRKTAGIAVLVLAALLLAGCASANTAAEAARETTAQRRESKRTARTLAVLWQSQRRHCELRP